MGAMRKRGQTLVEFALAAPLLFLVLLAIIQYGLIFNASLTLRHGAQVTSRSLALAGSVTNDAASIACQAIRPMLDCARLQPPLVRETNVNGNAAMSVQLTYRLPLIIPFVVPGSTGGQLTLTASAVDRKP